jgi:hypothetical protein
MLNKRTDLVLDEANGLTEHLVVVEAVLQFKGLVVGRWHVEKLDFLAENCGGEFR